MLTKSRVVQLLFMLVVLLFLFFWKTFNDEQPQTIEVEKSIVQVEQQVLPQSNLLRCDYDQACEFITEQGTFLLSINNTPIQPEQWIDFELTMANESSVVSKAKIVGKTMFMGKIPVRFKRSGKQQFMGKGIVGACTVDEMIWELQVSVINGDKTEQLSFDFMVKK